MKSIFLLSFLCAFCLWNCQSETSRSTTDEQLTPVADPNERWQQAFNADPNNLSSLYTDDVLKVNATGEVLNGSAAIAQALEAFKGEVGAVTGITTIENVVANRAATYEYEIGKFQTKDNSEYRHLVIWNIQDSIKKRELEFIAPFTANNTLDQEITTFRNQWIELCNQHNAQQLVEELYTENTIYYNHKPPVIGRIAVAAEYAYMNNENYTLSLEPIIVETVQDDLVFEVGQCVGSYGGKYVLVWKKQANGDWEVLLDSNI